MKYLLTFIAFLTLSLGYSQTELRKSSLSTGGGSASNGTTYMVYAIGEIGVQESTVGNTHLSEGFVGPDITTLVGIENYGVLENVSIFPNPVKDRLQIELPETNDYQVYLFDMTGKQIFEKNITDDNQATYHLGNLQAGVYILTVVDRIHKKSKTIKLQKL